MFDIGFSEMLVVGVVALIVVGPKDLPRMFRTLGEFTGKARRMAREFQTAMNQAADESGVNDIAGDLKKVTNPKKYGIDKIREATGDLASWTPDEHTGPETKALAETRAASKAAAKEKIAANAARLAEERAAREAADAAEASDEPELIPDPAAPAPAKPELAKPEPVEPEAKS